MTIQFNSTLITQLCYNLISSHGFHFNMQWHSFPSRKHFGYCAMRKAIALNLAYDNKNTISLETINLLYLRK